MPVPYATFAKPSEVLSFIRICLKNQDLDGLYSATELPTRVFWRERIFCDLEDIEKEMTLERVFLQETEFPEDQVKFKMGGHASITRHLHLDLIRVDGLWRLHKIWKCR